VSNTSSEVSKGWDAPWPYGYPGAVDSAGSVAAPLLAGFSFALVGLIVPEGKGIRWPSFTLALLVAAGFLFVAAVQCGFWARLWAVTPSEINEWTPTDPEERRHAEQRLHAAGFRLWSYRLTWAYRWGILALLAGVTLVLVPPGSPSAARWVAIGVASAGWLLEAVWIGSGWILQGSPTALFGNQPDVPKDGTRHLWIRRSSLLRRIARQFRPLIRGTQ
jgi:hypothetical protein